MLILDTVLEKNRLDKQEQQKIQQEIEAFIAELKALVDAEVTLGGSAAKGTMVKGDFDCDIFVRFDPPFKDSALPEMLEKALNIIGKPERIHGSRDYFRLERNCITYEIVPVICIESPDEARNVTDMSPLHVRWIRKKIDSNPKLTDEIILAKVFCKAQELYGAESHIRGFSGHVLDILVSYYGSFLELIENSLEWKKGQVIDIERHGTASRLNKSKLSPLIVIDPVDPHRNAAAALSTERFERFIEQAQNFKKEPSMSFFEKKVITVDELRSRYEGRLCLIVKAIPIEGKRDVSGSKVMQVFNHIRRQMRSHGFRLDDSGWQLQDSCALLWFVTPDDRLPRTYTRMGPPKKVKADAERFMTKHPDSYEKDGRFYAVVERDFRTPQDLIKNILQGRYVSERTKGAELL